MDSINAGRPALQSCPGGRLLQPPPRNLRFPSAGRRSEVRDPTVLFLPRAGAGALIHEQGQDRDPAGFPGYNNLSFNKLRVQQA